MSPVLNRRPNATGKGREEQRLEEERQKQAEEAKEMEAEKKREAEEARVWDSEALLASLVQTHCFTGTKVQILTQQTQVRAHEAQEMAKVAARLRYSGYLLYWYKSTNTDAASRRRMPVAPQLTEAELKLRVEDARKRMRMLETGGKRGVFVAKTELQVLQQASILWYFSTTNLNS